MTVKRLRAVLNSIGPPGPDEPTATPREIAEILWLAAHIFEDRPAPAPESAEPIPAEDRAEQPPMPSVPSPPPDPVRRELYGPVATSEEGTGAMTALVPTAPMLDHPLAVQRALRTLKRKVPSRRAMVLDEHATAERIASRPLRIRPWVPVMVAAPERWLSIVLVVDDGPSMRLWGPLARELHETLLRLGAFRDLRVCRLVPTDWGVGVVASPGAPPTDAATLIDPSGRQIVLVLSDCSGPYWWDGSAGRALRLWSKAEPTAILQPLAERLWRRTAAPTVPGTVVAARACVPNTALRFTPYDEEHRSGAVPVPVLECSPGWFADWATVVAGGGARPAAMTYLGDRPRGAEPVRQERDLPIRERVQRFQATASPEAAMLAAHVAVSFPALPVMRLIQQRILRVSQPSHLAEVILSGLLRPVDDAGRYDFVAGAREALLTTLPRSESWHTADVLSQISKEIERRAGSGTETFPAHLLAGDGDGDHVVGADDRPFALVSSEAIRLLNRRALPAEPRIVDVRSTDGLGEVGQIGEASDSTPSVAMSVNRLSVADLPRAEAGRVPIGRDMMTLEVIHFNLFHQDPNLVVAGNAGCGKTNLLRLIARGLTESFSPEQLSVTVVDPRGGLRDAVPSTHLNVYSAHARRAVGLVRNWLKDEEKGYTRSTSVGPRLVVLVDDYDQLTSSEMRLMAEIETISLNHRIGLHFVVASGVGREGLHSSFLMTLQEAATQVEMGFNQDEGVLAQPDTYVSLQLSGHGQWIRRHEEPRTVEVALVPQSLGRDEDRVPRVMLAVDIEAYSGLRERGQRQFQADLQQILDECETATHGLNRWNRQSTGDGELVVLPADTNPASFVKTFLRTIEPVLAALNADRRDRGRLRLRMALHHGTIDTSTASGIVAAFRLLNAKPLRNFLAHHLDRDLALIMSDSLCRELNRIDPTVLDDSRFVREQIRGKGETYVSFLYQGRNSDSR